jgi:hypothetical protein
MDSFTARVLNSAAEGLVLGIRSFSRSLAIPTFVVLLAAAAFCSTAFAQQDSGTAYSSPESNSASDSQGRTRFSLGGTVVNSVTGEPVQRALVSVSNRQYAMTDSSGHFQVDGLPRGDLMVTAEKPGFFNPEQTGSIQEPSVRVTLAADVGDVVVKLMPQAVVAGRITSLAGIPIEDFTVRLYARKIVEGRGQWQAAGTTQTDEDGQFRIPDLRPGEYCLSAGPEHKNLIVADAEEREAAAPKTKNRPHGYPEVFYADAFELASATPIDLLAGQQFQANFALNQEPLYEISGNVLGTPAEGGVGWALFNSSGEQLNSLRLRAQGQRFFGFVPAGRYTLRFFTRVNNQQLAATVPVNVAANLAGIQAVLAPETAIPVNIRVESGTPRLPGQSTLQAVVRLRPVAGGLDQNEYVSVPGQQGGVETYINGVPPGTYSVEVQAFGMTYVQSATSGATDLLSEPLVVPSGAKVDPIEVTLRADGGHVGGTVQGQGSGLVVLVPEHGDAGHIQAMEAQGAGSFSFDQVRPGDYFLVAIQQPGEFEYKSPEVLAPYLSRAAHVTLPPRQEVMINLEMVPTGK